MIRTILAIAAILTAAALTGCGVDREIYEAKVSELARMQTTSTEERDACKKKVDDLDKAGADSRKEREVLKQRISSLEDSLTQKQLELNKVMAELAALKAPPPDAKKDDRKGEKKADKKEPAKKGKK